MRQNLLTRNGKVPPLRSPQLIWRGLLVALVIIGLILAGEEIIFRFELSQLLSDSRVVNIAGRQRMLSQKITKASLGLMLASDAGEFNEKLNELKGATRLWQTSHSGLQLGDKNLGLPGENSEYVTELFQQIEPSHQTILVAVKSLIALAGEQGFDVFSQRDDYPLIDVITSHENIFLQGMDDIVFQYDAEAGRRGVIGVTFFIASLAVLVIIGAAVLRPAVRKAKKLEQLRDDFINLAAHDLRTPIAAIKGNIEMINKGTLGKFPKGEISEALEEIDKGANRMTSLINDFLTITRIEQGRFNVVAKACDLSDCVEQAMNEAIITSQDRPIEFKQQIGSDVPLGWCDKPKIIQVLVNILDNALKHTKEGSIAITVWRDSNPDFIRIEVSNTGSSIPEEDLPHIFERYFKGSAAEIVSGRGGGLGLGLHIVKMIIKEHGGVIWVENMPQGGVKFSFTLPVAKSDLGKQV